MHNSDSLVPDTILVVEDEAAIRGLMREILVMNGYHVLEANSGSQALEVATAWGGHLSLLITDMQMPGMSGREVARRLELLRPGLNTLYVSGYTEDEVLLGGIANSACAFLQKPFTMTGLLLQVKAALAELQPA